MIRLVLTVKPIMHCQITLPEGQAHTLKRSQVVKTQGVDFRNEGDLDTTDGGAHIL